VNAPRTARVTARGRYGGSTRIEGVDLGLKDRRAFVAAASKGLGFGCARALAAEGAKVFISSRSESAIEAAANKIGAAGWKAADVSKPGEPEAAVKEAISRLGGLDILVVNSGGPPAGTFQSTPVEAWDRAHGLLLMGAVRLIHAALPDLKASGQGRVVIITSVSVRQPIANLILSNSIRAAVTNLAKTLSLEVGPYGVTVNCLAPDAILTDRIRELAGGDAAQVERSIKESAERTPMRRMGDPDEFGATCAFLCSKQAGFITGQTIGIDGGTLMGVH
jgi:3-oxoacyl-[acyl-carrier protein] reductase